ncbi:hypothetical protein L1887_58463 [Cichorium endivia]|nr:hypothetical protein L1887_58463 [Cichorium endivia]
MVSAHRARTAQHSNLGHGRGEKASGSFGRRMAVQALAKLGPPERRVTVPPCTVFLRQCNDSISARPDNSFASAFSHRARKIRLKRHGLRGRAFADSSEYSTTHPGTRQWPSHLRHLWLS